MKSCLIQLRQRTIQANKLKAKPLHTFARFKRAPGHGQRLQMQSPFPERVFFNFFICVGAHAQKSAARQCAIERCAVRSSQIAKDGNSQRTVISSSASMGFDVQYFNGVADTPPRVQASRARKSVFPITVCGTRNGGGMPMTSGGERPKLMTRPLIRVIQV